MTRLNKIKIYFRILAAVLIITLTAAPGIALAAGLADSGQRVFDYAGLFDSGEEERMQEELEAIISHAEADVVILTIDDAGGKEAVAYADDFFDEEGFGIGDNYDGVLFLIDMDNRELTVSTSGSMIAVLPDYRLELMLDHIYEAAGEGNFEECAWRFIADLKVYYDQYLKDEARTAYDIAERRERESESAAAAAVSDTRNKKYEPGYKAEPREFSLEWYEVVLSLGVAVFVAVCVCKSVVNSYRMKGAGKGDAQFNLSYRAGCHLNNVDRRDTLIDRSVTTQVISRPSAPRADTSSRYNDDSSSYSSGWGSSSNSSSRASGRSTTHTSSSGRTHGGSSRSFSGGSSGGSSSSSGGSRSFSSGSSSRSSGSSSTHSSTRPSGGSSSRSSGPSSSRSSGRSSGGGRSHGGGSRKF